MWMRNTTCKKIRAWYPASKGRRSASQPARRNVELKRIRVSSIALRWVLAVSLTASPLLAQYTPQSDPAVPAHHAAVRVVDENNEPLVGNTIFSTLLTDSPAASTGQTDTQTGQVNTQRDGTELGAPKPSGNPDNQK